MANPFRDAQRAKQAASPKIDRLLLGGLGDKTPKAIAPENSNEMSPVWSLRRMDLDGPWGWKAIPRDHLWSLHERLVALESMPWGEIDNARDKVKNRLYHKHPIDQIGADARRRMRQLPHLRAAEIHRFLVCGLVRVWGFRVAHVFEVLWFDPKHEVYPT